MVELDGLEGDRPGGHDGVLGNGACLERRLEQNVGEDLVADLDAVDAFAHRFDDAGGVAAQHDRVAVLEHLLQRAGSDGPASVSESVMALERRLGGRLFERSTRRVELTEFGEQFLDDVRGPYEQLQRAFDSARRRRPGEAALVIAYTPELGHLYLPALLANAPRAPGAEAAGWRPVLMHTTEQLHEIEAGTVDVGLCWSAVVRRPLRSVPLADVPVVAVLRGDDPLARLPVVPLTELRTRRLLMIPRADNPFIDNRLQAGLVQVGVSTSDIDEVPRYDELVVSVVTTNRVGLHPATISMTNQIPGVVFRRVTEPDLTETVSLLMRGAQADPGVDHVVTVLAAATEELGLGRLRAL